MCVCWLCLCFRLSLVCICVHENVHIEFQQHGYYPLQTLTTSTHAGTRTQWSKLRSDDRPGIGAPPARQQSNGQSQQGAFAAPPRGGTGAGARPVEAKNDRFAAGEDGKSLREKMAEREERENKEKEKRAAREAARKEAKEAAEKEADVQPSRDALKKMALEERRQREADRRAREQVCARACVRACMHACVRVRAWVCVPVCARSGVCAEQHSHAQGVSAHEIQNADPQRGSTVKDKGAGARGGGSMQVPAGGGTKKQEEVQRPLADDFLYARGPTVPAWSGANPATLMFEDENKDGRDVLRLGGEETEVARSAADFVLDNEEHGSSDKVGSSILAASNLEARYGACVRACVRALA